jgi:hypothetical protein
MLVLFHLALPSDPFYLSFSDCARWLTHLASRWCGPWEPQRSLEGGRRQHLKDYFWASFLWGHDHGLAAVFDPASALSVVLSLQAFSLHPSDLHWQ